MLRLALHPGKRTLHRVQLRILGSTLQTTEHGKKPGFIALLVLYLGRHQCSQGWPVLPFCGQGNHVGLLNRGRGNTSRSIPAGRSVLWDIGTDLIAPFGLSTDLPVISDWNGDGTDEIGIWRASDHCFFLDTNGNYTWDRGTDLIANFGASPDLPVTGRWQKDGAFNK